MLVQTTTGHTILCGEPTDSEETPALIATESEKEDWLPIDTLFGRYNPTTRGIEVYYKNIANLAKQVDASSGDL